MCKGNTRRKQRKGAETIFEAMTTEFLQINVIHQTAVSGSSENTKKDKCKRIRKYT